MDKTKVLIVDDDEELALGLGIRLRASGYDVVLAHDAVLATTVARTQKPDLVILDLGLPGGDGFTVLERLQTNLNTALIPVIIVTARDNSHEKRALSAGAHSYFQKPADNEQLIAAIEAAVA